MVGGRCSSGGGHRRSVIEGKGCRSLRSAGAMAVDRMAPCPTATAAPGNGSVPRRGIGAGPLTTGSTRGGRYDVGMNDGSSTATVTRLTARGARTRAHIVATAAELIRVRGVGGTTLDDVVTAGQVSKSQLYRHFEDKTALVRAVIERVGEETIGRQRTMLEAVASLDDLRRWRDDMVRHIATQNGRYGCSLGSLANEVSDHDSIARAQLEALFAAWCDLFEEVLGRFQRDGIIPSDCDATNLAMGFVAAIQGGYLLAQSSRDAAPMAVALDMAIDHLAHLGAVEAG